jgi:nitroreductase
MNEMSSFLELVRQRRSVRRYRSDPVDRAVIDRCLEAARLAPSACNSQPWQFIVVDRDPLREQLARIAFAGAYRMNQFAAKAPVLIVVLRDRSRIAAALGGMFRDTVYSLTDQGIACEHLCLQAAEEGLGSCMLGWFAERRVKKLLHIPRPTRVDMIISLGYEDGDNPREKKRKPLDQIRRYATD